MKLCRAIPFLILFACSTRVSVQVGAFKVTALDVDYRTRYVRSQYPESDAVEFARRQLTTAYSYAEILRRKGFDITPSSLEKEVKEFESGAKGTEELARVRAAFDGDRFEYLRAFILPRIAEREVYRSVYAQDVELGRPEQIRASLFLSAALSARSPRELAAAEKKHGVSPYAIVLSGELGVVEPPLSVDRSPPVHSPVAALQGIVLGDPDMTKKWASELIAPLADGGFVRRPIDVGTAWVALRRGRAMSSSEYSVQLYAFPKRPYAQWLREQLLTVDVRRSDRKNNR